jgi:hypothetical protein
MKPINVVKALLLTLADQASTIATVFIGPLTKDLAVSLLPKTSSKWMFGSLFTEVAVDGAILSGVIPPTAWAKYTLPKGLPKEGQRFLAIENPPHLADDYNGVIESGYGKGTKTLLISQVVPVKVGNKSFLGKMNLHFHEAEKAGPHYDIVVEGVPPDTQQWELNLPNGEFKGRYAFLKTEKGTLVVPMKDKGILIPKPRYNLKPLEFLEKVNEANKNASGEKPYIIEWKGDGSLAQASIGESRAIFRSHRESASSYYDKLPVLESLKNSSRMYIWRKLFPRPNQSGTILRGELIHPDGVSRVSGILNSLPIRAQQTQALRGPVEFYAWDITKLRGKDVSRLHYGARRAILERVIEEVRFFNPNWKIVRKAGPNESVIEFYNSIINDVRGLPFSEGIVVKNALENDTWVKVKDKDLTDMVIIGFTRGEPGITGKYVNSLGSLTCKEVESGKIAVVGTGFSDIERQWIYTNRKHLEGAVIKALVFSETDKSFRAPRFTSEGSFVRFHPDSRTGNEYGLSLYSEALAGMDKDLALSTKFALKSSRGWTRKG